MRKKQHKKINPKNKEYDRFYIINYLVSEFSEVISIFNINLLIVKYCLKNEQECIIRFKNSRQSQAFLHPINT